MSSRSERTRKAILDTARRRLATPGDPARLDDIAKDAGVTRQTLHLHFRTRSALLLAAAQETDHVAEVEEQVAAIRACPDPVEALTMLVRFMVAYEPHVHGAAMAALRESAKDPDLHGIWEDRMDDRRKHIKHFIRRLKQEGRLKPGWSVQQITDAVWEISSPTSYEHLVIERRWSVESFERWVLTVARTFISGGDKR
jgi:AcrR family transcriptional regulator